MTMRELTGHRVNPANDKLTVTVMDEPGAGGACHLYRISGFDTRTNTSDESAVSGESTGQSEVDIVFQNGPIGEVGVNGVTQEALLAVLIDRLESFQSGQWACEENAFALNHLRDAQESLLRRTRRRMERGVEGTHAK